ncbi:hypothetical protein EX30DRAFT_338607 [Ascodesmis nigricans]|uniref:Large ribosomal subunit protein mL59 domain-containing protein n=1 Tax=Ascodesmis nigricans TaxID=341454 RepID=A0A4S2N4D7_9PEZI|nr:hypothetical protein EX30DRAFT_338607 [Ascodesmis nigricans]
MSSPVTTAVTSTYARLTTLLPPRLTKFFARFPPGTCNSAYTNPFKPTYNPATQKWRDPVYSLRRQAELCKMAKKWGVEELLPESRKRSDIREQLRAQRQERLKNLEVKGKREERLVKARVELRKKAMADMPKLILEWKRRGHGRGWKHWPSGKAQF